MDTGVAGRSGSLVVKHVMKASEHVRGGVTIHRPLMPGDLARAVPVSRVFAS